MRTSFLALSLVAFASLPATGQPVAPPSGSGVATATNRSGTITLGGQSQTLFAANSHRVGCEVQMLGGDVWLNIGAAASAGSGSFLISAGSEFICPTAPPTVAINIFSPVTGVAFSAVEYTR
jgi:hypothetical protein